MKLSVEFLQANPVLTTNFVGSTVSQRHAFFNELIKLASNDLALAHSTFKVSAARTVLLTSSNPALVKQADCIEIGSFSVHKAFDTVTATNGTITGTKHWITNLDQATYSVVQCVNSNEVTLFYVSLNQADSFDRSFDFLNAPGMMDTCTGDITFKQHPAILIFKKSDPKYFISNNHNSLCFIANHIGAVKGLIDKFDKLSKNKFAARFKNIVNLFNYEINNTSAETVSSDHFWHTRNALYLESKQLLSDICQYVVANCAGNFYNLNSAEGQHFYNSLIYSGHNGPISRLQNMLYTEPQDY